MQTQPTSAHSFSYIELPKLTGTSNHERSLVSLASVVVVGDAASAVADDDDVGNPPDV